MDTFVVDCSIAISWFLEDEADPKSDALLGALSSGEAVVPAIWPFEFTNALVIAERKGRISSRDLGKILTQVCRLPIIVEDGLKLEDWESFIALAQEYSLTIYDAAYLEAALRLKLPLATRDVQLSKAAARLSIQILPA